MWDSLHHSGRFGRYDCLFHLVFWVVIFKKIFQYEYKGPTLKKDKKGKGKAKLSDDENEDDKEASGNEEENIK